jgi:hypothetical protein
MEEFDRDAGEIALVKKLGRFNALEIPECVSPQQSPKKAPNHKDIATTQVLFNIGCVRGWGRSCLLLFGTSLGQVSAL